MKSLPCFARCVAGSKTILPSATWVSEAPIAAPSASVNIYDVLAHEQLVFTREAINALQDQLSK